jgi:hypothetical protein
MKARSLLSEMTALSNSIYQHTVIEISTNPEYYPKRTKFKGYMRNK